MNDRTLLAWSERATKALNDAFPWPEYDNWHQCHRLLPQVAAVAEQLKRLQLAFEEAGELFAKGGRFLHAQCDYSDGGVLRQSIRIVENDKGVESLEAAALLAAIRSWTKR